jgi:hypothetical protein
VESIQKSIAMDAANGWNGVIVRFVKVALVGFLVLQGKEYLDAGMFDTIATGTDALLIAAGAGMVDMLFMRRPQDRDKVSPAPR